jgi:putative transcriptional regulator
MATAKQYRSSLMASIHETAEELNAVGLMSKQTLREFNELCLTPAQPIARKRFGRFACAREPARQFLRTT